MKILVVEDDAPVAAFIKRGVLEEGRVVDVAGDVTVDDPYAGYLLAKPVFPLLHGHGSQDVW